MLLNCGSREKENEMQKPRWFQPARRLVCPSRALVACPWATALPQPSPSRVSRAPAKRPPYKLAAPFLSYMARLRLWCLAAWATSAAGRSCHKPSCYCDDTCIFSGDGQCDDSGPGASRSRTHVTTRRANPVLTGSDRPPASSLPPSRSIWRPHCIHLAPSLSAAAH